MECIYLFPNAKESLLRLDRTFGFGYPKIKDSGKRYDIENGCQYDPYSKHDKIHRIKSSTEDRNTKELCHLRERSNSEHQDTPDNPGLQQRKLDKTQ